MTTTIYALADPETKVVRYVGRTVRKLNKRLEGHVASAFDKRYEKNHRCNWIRSVVLRGLRPEIILLMNAESDGAEEERYQIRLARMAGLDLTNASDGGDGGGVNPSADTRQRMRLARLGKKLAPETCQRMSAYRKGRKLSPEWSANISKGKLAANYVPTPETRKKLSERPISDERRRQMSEAAKNRSPETWDYCRKISRQDEQKLCEMYRSGWRTVDIATHFNVRRFYVTDLLRKNKVPIRPHSLTPEQIEKMRRSKTGKKQSPEMVAKRMEGMRLAKERRRNYVVAQVSVQSFDEAPVIPTGTAAPMRR